MPFEKLAVMILPREVIGGHGAVEKVGDVFKKLPLCSVPLLQQFH